MQISGSYSRLTPRYPISLPCALVHTIEKRWPRKPEELVIAAETIELSLTGMAIAVHSTHDADRYRIGSRQRFRIHGLEGGLEVRHVYASGNGLRLGGEFIQLSPDLEEFVRTTIGNLRT